jgi:hypothetical protein
MMGILMVLPFMISCGNSCAKLSKITPQLAEGNAWQVGKCARDGQTLLSEVIKISDT